MRRVVVTGRGCVSGCGPDLASFHAALKRGESAIGPFEQDVGPLLMKVGAPVRGFDPEKYFDPRKLKQLDPVSQFALVAGHQAMTESGLTLSDEEAPRAGCIFGSGMGGQGTIDGITRGIYGAEKQAVPPLAVARAMVSASASQLSIEFKLRGPTFVVSSACASATHALGIAFQMIRSGAMDVAVSGGTEYCFTYGHLRAWDAMRVVASDTCRPFSLGRKGLVLGEGGAVLILEELEHAQRRGACILAEVLGFGMTADAHDLLHPSQSGMVGAMKQALADARLAPERVGHINAHGTGTQANDSTEAAAIVEVFAEHADNIAVTSSKSIHGHALGASGSFEALAAVLALQEGVIPPTAHFLEPDPACPLDVVTGEARQANLEAVLSNSFGFGGVNAVLALGRWNG